jgi:hypothetical protein
MGASGVLANPRCHYFRARARSEVVGRALRQQKLLPAIVPGLFNPGICPDDWRISNSVLLSGKLLADEDSKEQEDPLTLLSRFQGHLRTDRYSRRQDVTVPRDLIHHCTRGPVLLYPLH